MFSDNWDNDLFDAYNGEAVEYPDRLDYARDLNMFIKTADPDWIEWFIGQF